MPILVNVRIDIFRNNILRASVNKLFKNNFEMTFMRNIKTVNKLVVFFCHKNFVKIFFKLMPLEYLLTFSVKII